MPLQISEKVMALAAQAQAGLRDQFDRIDSIAEENTRKVLAAFQKHRVAGGSFAGATHLLAAMTISAGTSWMGSSRSCSAPRMP